MTLDIIFSPLSVAKEVRDNNNSMIGRDGSLLLPANKTNATMATLSSQCGQYVKRWSIGNHTPLDRKMKRTSNK